MTSSTPSHLKPRRIAAERSRKARTAAGPMTWLAYSALALAALAAAAVTFVIVAAPVQSVRDHLVQQVLARTGRTLAIAGGTSFSIFPAFAVTLSGVSLSAPPGMDGGPTVRIPALEVGVPFWPLLQGRVNVERLVLVRPEVELRIDAHGRRSWESAKRRTADSSTRSDSSTRLPEGSPGVGAVKRSPGGKLRRVPQELRIEQGAVSYVDERSGTKKDLTDFDAQLSLASLAAPLTGRGATTYHGEKVSFTVELESPENVLAAEAARFTVALSSRFGTATFAGGISAGSARELDGKLVVEAPSLKAAASWFGSPLPEARGFGPFALTANLQTAAEAVTASEIDLRLDGAAATGTIAVVRGPVRPRIKADLQISELDLNKYLRQSAVRKTAAAQRQEAPAAQRQEPPTASEDRTGGGAAPDKSGATGKSSARNEGWSEEPFDLDVLARAEVAATLVIGRLLHRDLTAGQTQLSLRIEGGVLDADAKDIQLYDGRGRGRLRLAASEAGLSMSTNLAAEGVSMQPLLKNAAGINWLSGQGKLTLTVTGQGRSEHNLVTSLEGTADVAVTNGTLGGVNIAKILRDLQRGRFSNLGGGAAETTDFAEFAASFRVANGVAHNEDLRIASPLLRATGAGTISVVERQLDCTLRPKIVAALTGQGGAADRAGIEIPVKVTGRWDKPRFQVDGAALQKDAGRIVDTVKQLGKQLKDVLKQR